MTPLSRSTIIDAAEHVMRTHVAHSDQPLLRLEALASELFVAFRGAAEAGHEASPIEDLAAAFRIAFKRLWIDLGGDPSSVPVIEFPLDDPPSSTWRSQVIPQ